MHMSQPSLAAGDVIKASEESSGSPSEAVGLPEQTSTYKHRIHTYTIHPVVVLIIIHSQKK